MKTVPVWRVSLVLIGFIVVLGMVAITGGLDKPKLGDNGDRAELSLSRPSFISNVSAAADFDIGAYLDQEAGISAWLYSAFTINLTNAATAFRVIEDQTSDYIIGSVALPNYSEHFDAHVYVHKDGWILAYYLRPDPASKIIAIKEHSITTTNLASIVGIVAGAAGVPSSGINYYDFRYPNAENILLVYEDNSGGNDFTINMPSTFAYYERGWALHDTVCCGVVFNLNGTALSATYANNNAYYGIISAAQLAPDVIHTIFVDDIGVLMIIYTEP